MAVPTSSPSSASTPIPGLTRLPGHGDPRSEISTYRIWPPSPPGIAELTRFVPAANYLSGCEYLALTQGFRARHANWILTVLSGGMFAAWVDLRTDHEFGRSFVTELGAGSSFLVPRGVAFGFQVLTPPIQFSQLADAACGDDELADRFIDPFDPDLAIPWPITPPQAQLPDLSQVLVPLAAADRFGPEAQPGRPFRVVFVCTANICRSAYADVAANARPHRGLQFRSAGVQALVGRPIDPPMADCLPPGADSASHRARQLTRTDMVEADLILAMAAEHRRYILEEWPDLGRKTFVLGHVAREIQHAPVDLTLDRLTDHLWRRRTSDPDDDVADPYRRGPDAAGAAARKIDAYLNVVVDSLVRLSARSTP